MNITKEGLERFGLTLEQAACLLLVSEEKSAANIKDILDSLCAKGWCYKYTSSGSDYLYYISTEGTELLQNMDLYTKTKDNGVNYINLASELRKLFPKGLKPGTNSRWVDGIALVAKRLKQFTVKYGDFEPDEIIDATKRYISSFNGDYSRMRTLRYFIWAEKRNPSTGEVEYTSDLLSYLEDPEDKDIMSDWEVSLR